MTQSNWHEPGNPLFKQWCLYGPFSPLSCSLNQMVEESVGCKTLLDELIHPCRQLHQQNLEYRYPKEHQVLKYWDDLIQVQSLGATHIFRYFFYKVLGFQTTWTAKPTWQPLANSSQQQNGLGFAHLASNTLLGNRVLVNQNKLHIVCKSINIEPNDSFFNKQSFIFIQESIKNHFKNGHVFCSIQLEDVNPTRLGHSRLGCSKLNNSTLYNLANIPLFTIENKS